LRGEAVDAAVQLELGLHRLERTHAGATVLQHAEQHCPCGGVVRLGGGVAVVGLVEGDVCDVGFAAAAHGDVQVLPRGGWRDHNVRRVDSDALGAVGCDG